MRQTITLSIFGLVAVAGLSLFALQVVALPSAPAVNVAGAAPTRNTHSATVTVNSGNELVVKMSTFENTNNPTMMMMP